MTEPSPAKSPLVNKDYVFLGLIISGLITLILSQFSLGNTILYPFTILGTWFHEMGHGITAWLLGGNFSYLEIFPNGSGLAHISYGKLRVSNDFGQSLISAGGLLGPPLLGAFFIMMGARQTPSRIALVLLGVALTVSAIIWVRTPIGLAIIIGFAVVAGLLALKAPRSVQMFAIQFFGVQAAVTTYKQVWYLFQGEAIIGGKVYLSDTGQIAAQTGIPYWFWGALIAVISAILLIGSLWLVFRGNRAEPAR